MNHDRLRTAGYIMSLLRSSSGNPESERPRTSPGALGRTFDPSISTFPDPNPFIKPAAPGLQVQAQIETYIDTVLVPLLKTQARTYTVSVLCIHKQDTILVLVAEPELLVLPDEFITGYVIQKGEVLASIHA